MAGIKNRWKKFIEEENSSAAKTNRHGMKILYEKELSDHLNSIRFRILFLLLAVIMFIALYGAIGTISSAAQSTDAKTAAAATSEFIFLKLFTTSGSNIYSFSTFIAFLGPLVGIMLGFDAINEEMAQGTLNRLAAQPIYRDTIINAKFLAGATAVAIMIFSIGGIAAGFSMVVTGLIPTGEQVARLVIYLLLATVYICLWLAWAEFFSVVCRHAATAALACVAIWLVLTLFQSLIASGIASLVYPLTGANAQINVLNNYQTQMTWNRVSPYYLFSEITSILMNPNVHSTNVISIMESQEGAVASYLTLGQSMLQIVPHIITMIAAAAVGFAAAYISFMRKEIRA